VSARYSSLLVLALTAGCAKSAQPGDPTAQLSWDPSVSCADDHAIQSVPDTAEHRSYRSNGFDRYIEIAGDNGLPIRIYAQDGVDDAQMMRALGLLRFFLADAPGTRFGSDKREVANAMGTNGAVLMMPNGAHEEGNEPKLPAQPLYAHETPVEGHSWYMDNDYTHRDAGFEEIFHLVHDMGIGTDAPGALPEYQDLLLAEAKEALEDGRWGSEPEIQGWIKELEQEGSLAQEYIAAVLDSAMGLWSAFPEPGGMWGFYVAKDRSELETLDPGGLALLFDFLSPQITSEIRLHPSFDGTFEMAVDPELLYTFKSQYLQHVALTGVNDASLTGNAHDNTLRGNVGDNTLRGGEGRDTAVYCGPAADYTVAQAADGWTVTGPDGSDTLIDMEVLWFTDGTQDLTTP